MADADCDALSLWVEHGSQHAARCASVSSMVQAARCSALDAMRDAPTLPPLFSSEGISEDLHAFAPKTDTSRGVSNPFADLSVRGTPLNITPAVRSRQRTALRALRKRHHAAIRADEDSRRVVAIREYRAKEERRKAVETERQRIVERARNDAAAAAAAEAAAEQRRIALQKEAKEAEERQRIALEKEAREAAAAEEKKKKSAAADAAAAAAAAAAAPGMELPKHVIEAGKSWARVSAEAESFKNDPNMKKARLLLKKRVNRAVNQIAASVKKVCSTVDALVATIGEARSSGIPTALSYTYREIAERLVAEGSTSVSLAASASFSVGAVIVGVTAHAPDPALLRDVIFAAFCDKCAYVIPTYVRRAKGETDASFRKRLGYLTDEKPEAYAERMGGYVALYAAVVQTRDVYGPTGKSNSKNPFGLDQAWSWLARVSNGPQRPITPDIVIAFLDIAAFELARAFGPNFRKLLHSVGQFCVVNANAKARPGAKSRISALVAEYEQSGGRILKPPTGKVLPVRDAENVV